MTPSQRHCSNARCISNFSINQDSEKKTRPSRMATNISLRAHNANISYFGKADRLYCFDSNSACIEPLGDAVILMAFPLIAFDYEKYSLLWISSFTFPPLGSHQT